MTVAIRASRILLLAVMAGLGACSKAPESTEEIRTVMVQTATAAPYQSTQLVGEVRARHEVELAFRVGGKIEARLVDAGSEIRAGQLLARLDPQDLKLAASAAAAQLAAAESEVATARAERDRYAGLLERKFVSQAAFDTRQHTLNAAQAHLEQARAQHSISSNQADYGSLRADFPGVVAAVLADAGQVVAAGQPVLRVARPEEKEVLVAVPEGQIGALRQAEKITVSLWSAPGLAITGKLRELGAVADPQTRTYPARIALLAPPPQVMLGMTASVDLDAAAAASTMVPLAAVGDSGNGPFVWLVENGKVSKRAVRVGGFRANGVDIVDGLHGNETIVVAGISLLVEGQTVRPQPAPAPAAQR